MKRILVLVWSCLWLSTGVWAQTPHVHYRQGARELDDGNVEAAAEEFKKARALDRKFAPAYVGLALVEMERMNYRGAFELLKAGQKYDKKLADVYMAKSRVYMQEGKKDWKKRALKELERARKINSGDDRIAFYRGRVLQKAGDLNLAAQAFAQAVAQKGTMEKEAAEAQQQVLFILRALPDVQRSGRLVALKAVATRADLALLFVDEFDLQKWLKRHRIEMPDTQFVVHTSVAAPAAPKRIIPPDVSGHPNRNLIIDALAMNVPGIELDPNGQFGPARPITRVEFAQIMQGLLALERKDRELATRYFGEASRFGDLRSDHFAYNAAVVCIQRGIIQPRPDGRFYPQGTVSGAEVILGIKETMGF